MQKNSLWTRIVFVMLAILLVGTTIVSAQEATPVGIPATIEEALDLYCQGGFALVFGPDSPYGLSQLPDVEPCAEPRLYDATEWWSDQVSGEQFGFRYRLTWEEVIALRDEMNPKGGSVWMVELIKFDAQALAQEQYTCNWEGRNMLVRLPDQDSTMNVRKEPVDTAEIIAGVASETRFQALNARMVGNVCYVRGTVTYNGANVQGWMQARTAEGFELIIPDPFYDGLEPIRFDNGVLPVLNLLDGDAIVVFEPWHSPVKNEGFATVVRKDQLADFVNFGSIELPSPMRDESAIAWTDGTIWLPTCKYQLTASARFAVFAQSNTVSEQRGDMPEGQYCILGKSADGLWYAVRGSEFWGWTPVSSFNDVPDVELPVLSPYTPAITVEVTAEPTVAPTALPSLATPAPTAQAAQGG